MLVRSSSSLRLLTTDPYSEVERQKIIAENRALLDSLGFEEGGSAKLGLAKPKPIAKPSSHAASKKRKSTPVKSEEGPRRRSGRIAGIEASVEVLQAKAEEEEKEREVLRVINRKTRDQVMAIKDMLEDTEENDKVELVCLVDINDTHYGRGQTDVAERLREGSL